MLKVFLLDSDDKHSTVIVNRCWANFDQKSLYKILYRIALKVKMTVINKKISTIKKSHFVEGTGILIINYF